MVLKAKSVFLFLFIYHLSFCQTTYIESVIANECIVCTNEKKVKVSQNLWHQAHLAFEKKKYEKTIELLLKDVESNVCLKKLLKGNVFFRLKLYDKSLMLFKDEVLLNHRKYHLAALKGISEYYLVKNKDSAVIYYNRILNEKNLPVRLRNEVYEGIAYVNVTEEKFDEAHFFYEKLLSFYKKEQDFLSLGRTYTNLGNSYFEQYKDNKAKKYLDSAYVVSKVTNNQKLRSRIAYNLYLVSEALKEHKEAVQYLKEYNILQDSIQTEKTIWKIAEQKEAFNLEKKQVEIDQKTKQRNVFVVFSLVILLLLLAIFWFYKKLQLKHQQIGILNEELKETNALKNQIFSIVAHDLRSPVALLKQKFQLQTVNEEDETITIDKNVVSIIDSLSFLLDNLLSWSLSQSNLLHVEKDWFPLLPVVKQIEHQYKSLLADKEIVFKIENLYSVLLFGDMELFKIVVRNCLDNAIKFTPKGGEITISGVAESEFFKLIIQDSGTGIPEDVLKTLFELNAKKAQKDTQGRKSSGLGLHLVKSMIELNNGTIQIQNNPRGGTNVNISVPYKNIA